MSWALRSINLQVVTVGLDDRRPAAGDALADERAVVVIRVLRDRAGAAPVRGFEPGIEVGLLGEGVEGQAHDQRGRRQQRRNAAHEERQAVARQHAVGATDRHPYWISQMALPSYSLPEIIWLYCPKRKIRLWQQPNQQ